MAYSNVSVTDGHDVLQQIATFAASAGWNIHFNGARPSNTEDKMVVISRTGAPPYLFLMYDHSESVINMNASYDLDLAEDWDAQLAQFNSTANHTKTATTLRVASLLSVHLFSGTTPQPYIYCAIEKEPGYYRHLMFGYMDKFGSYLGGFFWDVSDTGDYYRSDIDVVYLPFLQYNNSNTGLRYGRRGGLDCQDVQGAQMWASFSTWYTNPYSVCGMPFSELYDQFLVNPNSLTFRTTLIPLTVYVRIGTDFYPYGTPPNIRYVNMEHYSAGDEITIGSDIWKVFPVIRKMTPPNSVSFTDPEHEGSQNYGIAYLKN